MLQAPPTVMPRPSLGPASPKELVTRVRLGGLPFAWLNSCLKGQRQTLNEIIFYHKFHF